jgi:bifunctional non-homologous end joining protein LigD
VTGTDPAETDPAGTDPAGTDRLGPYRAKRSFEQTPEPDGAARTGAGAEDRPATGPAGATDTGPAGSTDTSPEGGTDTSPAGVTGAPRFVIQKHDARRLHYDFRLEADGVLVSWAVPKGPSYNPGSKRLAVHVEDHPLDYRTFEGVIPGAQYGSGTVIVWDEGTYRNLTQRDGTAIGVADAVRRGHLSIWLEGSKLTGGWSLTRTGGRGDRESWILVKRRDDRADTGIDITVSAPDSVRSGRSLAEVAADTSRPDGTSDRAAWTPPMLAQLVKPADRSRPAPGDGWRYERKLDGLRCEAVRNGPDVELWSRNHLSFNRRFPAIVAALARLPVDTFTLDGEIVAYEGERTSFALLQHGGSTATPVYCVFDLLHLLGQDTTGLPLTDRRALLDQALAGTSGDVTPVDALDGDPDALLRQACADGWEYRSGRSSAWQKLKCTASQELVIGGWTDPSGARTGFGALLVGYYDDTGALQYAGKVGTGFDEARLRSLSVTLAALTRAENPFAGPVGVKAAHWVRPELVGAVSFTEWTTDGRLRHPSFQGLREDRDPAAVRRES